MKAVAALGVALVDVLLASGCSREKEPFFPEREDLVRSPETWLRQEPVRILRDYVRIDTSIGRGEEEGARFLENILSCAGIETEIVCPAPRRCNLLARVPGRQREGALLLLNHIDVAEVFPEFWKEASPFEGKIKAGFLYGRGGYDMKGIAIAQLLALRALKQHGIVPASDVLFLAEADEETTQRWGSQWLLSHRPEWFAGVRQVLNEGGFNEMVLRTVRDWGLETVQAGYAVGEFESSSSAPLEELAKPWQKLKSDPVEPHPQVRMAFDRLANHLVAPLTDPLRHLDRVARDPKELALLPDRYGSFLQPRIYWSPPYAFPPKTKEKFRIFFYVSTPPGVDPDPFSEPILRDAKRLGIRSISSLSSGVTTASPYPTAFTDLLKDVTQAHYPGIPFGPVPTYSATTSSIFFRRRGIPAYGYTPIPMNITDAARRHGNDERIYLRDYVSGVDLLRDVVEGFALPRQELSVKTARP